MKHKVQAFGKQVKVNDRHWADCVRENAALIVAQALRDYFNKGDG